MTDAMSLMSARGLVEITDPEFDRPVFRQPGFDGTLTAKEMDEKISAWLKKTREAKGISRADLAHLLGLLRICLREVRARLRSSVVDPAPDTSL